MTDFVLGKSTKLRTIAIRVKDRDKAIAFYRDVLGFDLKREENELAIFGFKGAEGEVIWLEVHGPMIILGKSKKCNGSA